MEPLCNICTHAREFGGAAAFIVNSDSRDSSAYPTPARLRLAQSHTKVGLSRSAKRYETKRNAVPSIPGPFRKNLSILSIPLRFVALAFSVVIEQSYDALLSACTNVRCTEHGVELLLTAFKRSKRGPRAIARHTLSELSQIITSHVLAGNKARKKETADKMIKWIADHAPRHSF